MEEPGIQASEPATPKRSQLLTVICILTFIGSGMNIFSSFFVAGFFDTFLVLADDIGEQFGIPMADLFANATPLYFIITGFVYIGSVTGAVMMWRMIRNGFHVYTISQILLLIAPMYFLKLPAPSLLGLLITGLFIILYSTQLKYMH